MKNITIFCLIFFAFCLKDNFAVDTWFKGYRFEAKVITHKYGHAKEYARGPKQFIYVQDGDEYSILIKNPLPVTVAVVVSVDGLNVIDGTRKKPAESSKWLLQPYASMSIRGWQTGKKSLRRFYFTREKHSYAKWKEKYDHRRYAQNLGVIGVAYFWDSRALAYAINPPQPFANSKSKNNGKKFRDNNSESSSKSQASKKAGTGMGRKEYNQVKRVNFHFDTGMYYNRNVLKIFYEFEKYVEPQPFEDNNKGFAPDMNKIIQKVFGKGKWNYNSNNSNRNYLYDHPYLKIARTNVLLTKMRKIQILLHMYNAENNKFPASLDILIHDGYLLVLPDSIDGHWIYQNKTGKLTHSSLCNS